VSRKLFLLSVLVGCISGLGAVLFRNVIKIFKILFFHDLSFLPLFLIPAIGGLIVGIIIKMGAPQARGHGVPEVLEAVLLKSGIIKLKVAITKILASSISIASGGSVGREGPIVQIGSTLGSFIAQKFNLSKQEIITLVGAGASGGVAGTFNAPIAGVFFSLEIILRDFTVRSITPVVISSVISSFISHIFFGDVPAFLIPSYKISSYLELLNFALLGAFAGIIGVLFIKTLYKLEDIFLSTKLPSYIQPAIGGLIVGLIGMYYSEIFGVGYEAIENAIFDKYPTKLLLVLLFLKIIATSITIGSGGSGGVFAPSLFLGTMLGTYWGNVSKTIFNFKTDPGAYGIVGMGAVVTATTHAPLTSLLIIFEMTRNYSLILPLMSAIATGIVVSQSLSKESIYTMKLARRGVHVFGSSDKDIMKRIKIGDVMVKDIVVIKEGEEAEEIKRKIMNYPYIEYPFIDKEGKFKGIIDQSGIKKFLAENKEKIDYSLVKRNYNTAIPETTLNEIWDRYGEGGLTHIWVVDEKNPEKLVGVCTYKNILDFYYKIFLKES